MTPTSAIVEEPHLLAFFFSPNVALDVYAEITRVEDGEQIEMTMTLREDLSSTMSNVYVAEYTPMVAGWYMVQYRAIAQDSGSLVLANTSRFKAEGEAVNRSVTRTIEEGAMKTQFNAVVMGQQGVLTFKTNRAS